MKWSIILCAVLALATGCAPARPAAPATWAIVALTAGAQAGALNPGQTPFLTPSDRKIMQAHAVAALEKNVPQETTFWINPQTDHGGSFTPVNTYMVQGRPCREFSQTVAVRQSEVRAFGTACREADGRWVIR